MKRDEAEWLKSEIIKNSFLPKLTVVDDYTYVVESESVLNYIDRINEAGCNWKPSSQKPNLIDGMINGGDCPIQEIRDMLGSKSSEQRQELPDGWDNVDTSPEPENVPSLNPKAVLHSNITAELNAIYIAKNSDYGDAFGETYKKLGIISAVTRITDKVNRLQSLATKSESERLVKDETILDTLKDAANYILMTLIEMGYDPDKGGD